MTATAKSEIFIQTLTMMVEAYREEKGARHRMQCRTYAERFLISNRDGIAGSAQMRAPVSARAPDGQHLD